MPKKIGGHGKVANFKILPMKEFDENGTEIRTRGYAYNEEGKVVDRKTFSKQIVEKYREATRGG